MHLDYRAFPVFIRCLTLLFSLNLEIDDPGSIRGHLIGLKKDVQIGFIVEIKFLCHCIQSLEIRIQHNAILCSLYFEFFGHS